MPAGLDSLARLRRKIVEKPGARTRPPEFMAVIVGIGERAYQPAEGVYVVPLSALGA